MASKTQNIINLNNFSKILNWFSETCLRFLNHSKFIYLKYPQDFDKPDFASISALFNKEFLDHISFVDNEDIKDLASEYFTTFTNDSSNIESLISANPLNQSPILVIYNFEAPSNGAQLWYLNHHIVYSRLINKQSVIFLSRYDFDEFVNSGLNCPDYEYANYQLSFTKIIKLIKSCFTDVNLFFRQSRPPALTMIELALIQKLHEKKIPITIGSLINDIPVYISVVNEKIKLSIEIDPISHFDSILFQAQKSKQYLVLVSDGWQILKFTTKEINENPDECLNTIEGILNSAKGKFGLGRLIDNAIVKANVSSFNADTYQTLSIDHRAGPSLTKGIAGSGKTRVLVQKLIDLISNGVNPEKIIVFFHSGNSLRRSKDLLENILSKSNLAKLTLTTFEDFGLRFAKENTSSIKRRMPVKIENNSIKVLAKILSKIERELDPDFKEVFFDLDEFILLSVIAFYKANLLNPDAVKDLAKNTTDELVYKIYLAYEEQLLRSNRIDKEDLIKLTAQVLASNETIAYNYQKNFDYVFCDDYQEITLASDLILRILCYPNDNLFLFGDPYNCLNQSTGSLPGYMHNILVKLPNAQIYELKNNWRIPSGLLNLTTKIAGLIYPGHAANNAIAQKIDNLSVIGPKIFKSEVLESNWIAEEIETLIDTGRNLDEIAVLFRNSNYASIIADSLDKKHIPFVLQNIDTNTLPNEESDIIAFLKLVHDPEAPKARDSFEKILTIKLKDIDTKHLAEIASFAEANNLAYLKAIEIYSKLHKDSVSSELAALVQFIFKMNKLNLTPQAAIDSFVDKFKLIEYYKSFKIPQEINYDPLKKINHMRESCQNFKTIFEFLDFYNKGSKTNALKTQKINLLNIHEALGLEFNIIFIPGLAKGYFPSLDDENLIDEYRLLYTAMTRSSEYLYLCVPLQINENSVEPSVFLSLLGLEYNSETLTKSNGSESAKYSSNKLINETSLNASKANPVTAEPNSYSIDLKPNDYGKKILNESSQNIDNTTINTNTNQVFSIQNSVSNEIMSQEPSKNLHNDEVSAKSPKIKPSLTGHENVDVHNAANLDKVNHLTPDNDDLANRNEVLDVSSETKKPVLNSRKEFITNNISPDFLMQTNSVISGSNEIISQMKHSHSTPISQESPNKVSDSQSVVKDKHPPADNSKPPGKPSCPNCHNPLEGNSQFCGECGFRLPVRIPTCKACNEPIDPEAKFCGECGFKVI